MLASTRLPAIRRHGAIAPRKMELDPSLVHDQQRRMGDPEFVGSGDEDVRESPRAHELQHFRRIGPFERLTGMHQLFYAPRVRRCPAPRSPRRARRRVLAAAARCAAA